MRRDTYSMPELPHQASSVQPSLDRVPLGQTFVVHRVLPDPGAPERARQLEEIGFYPGEHVMVMTRGIPGGDPLVVRVGQSTFLALPEKGARLMNWNLTLADGSVRDVIYWPELKSLDDFPRIRGGNPLLFPFCGRTFDGGEQGFWRAADGVRGRRRSASTSFSTSPGAPSGSPSTRSSSAGVTRTYSPIMLMDGC